MNRFIRFFVLFILLTGLFTLNAIAQQGKLYGKGISLKDTTAISTLLQHPEKYVNKKVLIKGRIVDVCKKRGCWMEIAGDKEFQSIRIKVKDGEIVFPLEARGKIALAEGIFEKLVISKEQLLKQMKHHAEEHGETFDPSKITEGKVIYRLRGLGAKIFM